MNWWREQWRREDGLFANLSWFIVVAIHVGAIVGPATAAAVAMSFIVPVERWFAVVAVLMGWAIQWRLWPLVYDGLAVPIGVAAAWIFGAFMAASLLGPVPALGIIIVALEITLWAIGRWQAFALYRAVNADDPDDEWPDPQEIFDVGRARMRARMVELWHVDEGDVDRLLEQWDVVAGMRGLDRFDWQYWPEGEVWLRKKAGVSDDVQAPGAPAPHRL